MTPARQIFLWGLLVTWLPASYLLGEPHKAEKKEPKAAQEIPIDKSFDQPSLSDQITLLSPSREPWVKKYYPVVPESFKLIVPNFDWAALGITPPQEWTYGGKTYDTLNDIVTTQMKATGADQLEERTYLKADLLLFAHWQEEKNQLTKAMEAYQEAITKFPKSSHAIRAIYHTAMIKIIMGQYRECVDLVYQNESLWKDQPEWIGRFRSIVMEAYFLRGRYARSEDYIWDLASRLNKEDLSSHLALRYGDSLFLQGKFSEAADWYQNMRSFLESTDTTAGKISRLYFAESLFQMGKSAEAKDQFEKANPTDQQAAEIAAYRILQCQLEQEKTPEKFISKFQSLVGESADTTIRQLAQVQAARLLTSRGDSLLQETAISRLRMFLNDRVIAAMQPDVLLTLGTLQALKGDDISALRSLSPLIPVVVLPDKITPLERTASNIAVILILGRAHKYQEVHDPEGFLLLCERWNHAIQISSIKLPLLVEIGHTYMESGMSLAASRLFKRILVELHPSPEQKVKITLKLAQTYQDMGALDLSSETLNLLPQPPEDVTQRKIYHLIKVSAALKQENFEECIKQYDELLKSGVTGDELFKFSVDAAICARKAKKYDDALKFIGILGVSDDKIPSTEGVSADVKKWQTVGIFEKMTVLTAMNQPKEAIELFEQFRSKSPDSAIPIEIVFSIVKAYQQEHRPDDAETLWKEFSDKNTSLPDNLKTQYSQTLETLSQRELLPEK